MLKRADLPRPLPWRGVAVYLLIFTLVGIALGIAREMTGWSEGVAFVVTVVVGTPISLVAARDAVNWLRRSNEGRRTSRPPSA
jgi:hypothetical protein